MNKEILACRPASMGDVMLDSEVGKHYYNAVWMIFHFSSIFLLKGD